MKSGQVYNRFTQSQTIEEANEGLMKLKEKTTTKRKKNEEANECDASSKLSSRVQKALSFYSF